MLSLSIFVLAGIFLIFICPWILLWIYIQKRNYRQISGLLKEIETHIVEYKQKAISQNEEKYLQIMQEIIKQDQSAMHDHFHRLFQEIQQRWEMAHSYLLKVPPIHQTLSTLEEQLKGTYHRGMWGEWQLRNLLQDCLPPHQYEQNVSVRPGTQERVDFALKVTIQGKTRWLPIDAKFPCFDTDDDTFEKRISAEAKKISTKYINPPITTEFAFLFLPFDSLYQKAVAKKLLQTLMSRHQIWIVGPTTLGSFLTLWKNVYGPQPLDLTDQSVWTLFRKIPIYIEKMEEAYDNIVRYQKLQEQNIEILRHNLENVMQLYRVLENTSTPLSVRECSETLSECESPNH